MVLGLLVTIEYKPREVTNSFQKSPIEQWWDLLLYMDLMAEWSNGGTGLDGTNCNLRTDASLQMVCIHSDVYLHNRKYSIHESKHLFIHTVSYRFEFDMPFARMSLMILLLFTISYTDSQKMGYLSKLHRFTTDKSQSMSHLQTIIVPTHQSCARRSYTWNKTKMVKISDKSFISFKQ